MEVAAFRQDADITWVTMARVALARGRRQMERRRDDAVAGIAPIALAADRRAFIRR